MIDINLIEFVLRCKRANVTPSEKEIDVFLRVIGRMDLRESFIYFCFYCWHKVNNEGFIDEMIEAL